MNQQPLSTQQKVKQVFLKLLEQGTTTTLDVKNLLRKMYPNEDWTQKSVSNHCNDIYELSENIDYVDNGNYRIYYQTNYQMHTYTYTYKTRAGLELASNQLDHVIKTASLLGENIHYSESKKCFILIEDMASEHLYNAIRLRLDNITDTETFAFFMIESPLVKELLSRFQ